MLINLFIGTFLGESILSNVNKLVRPFPDSCQLMNGMYRLT